MLTGKWTLPVLEDELAGKEKQLLDCDNRGRETFERQRQKKIQYEENRLKLENKKKEALQHDVQEELDTLEYDKQELETEISDMQLELSELIQLKQQLTQRVNQLRKLRKELE